MNQSIEDIVFDAKHPFYLFSAKNFGEALAEMTDDKVKLLAELVIKNQDSEISEFLTDIAKANVFKRAEEEAQRDDYINDAKACGRCKDVGCSSCHVV